MNFIRNHPLSALKVSKQISTRCMSEQGFDPKYRQLSIKLDRIAPRIDLPEGTVKILQDPAQFYDHLKQKIGTAKRRIFLSTLYIGQSEHELIDVLRQRLREVPDLKVSILTDALRGTRESPNASCASLIAPLVTEFGDRRVELSMFHTPHLHGMRKRIIPRRFDEGWGLQHMKLYGFDDEIILSGANLSHDYFTDRQDRYHIFSSVPLTRFYEQLHDAIASISYKVIPSDIPAGYELRWTSRSCPEPTSHPKVYRKYAKKMLSDLITAKPLEHCQFADGKPPASIIYPLVQFGSLLPPSQSTEQPAVNQVLDMLSDPEHKESIWYFTAGYFNVFKEYRARLLKALGNGTIITASPDANGFYKSSGPSGMLAAGYTLLSKRFLDDIKKNDKTDSITLREWTRGLHGQPDRWTYHAKGLWVYPQSDQSVAPSLTFVGSSNLTRRSQSLDLEATALLISADPQLQRQLGEEVQNLQKYASTVTAAELRTPERKANTMTRFALWLCQGML